MSHGSTGLFSEMASEPGQAMPQNQQTVQRYLKLSMRLRAAIPDMHKGRSTAPSILTDTFIAGEQRLDRSPKSHHVEWK